MNDQDIEAIQAAMAALESQRATLGDAVLELALAPLRARLAELTRPAGLQRRQVAVLFADVVDSTALAQRLGPEDTVELLGGTLRRMADIVQAHQGRVLRFTGDGLKAAFGMDAAREDDAERAVRAGVAMLALGREQAATARQAYGVPDFAVRVGVHTGDVALGAGVEADNTAMGAAVHIAARMEQSAPPGALRISHDTWSHVRGLFEFEPQAPLEVKGVAEPMRTYLVHGALERSAASVERGLQGLATPMVGRDDELQHLRQAVKRARDGGSLQAVTVLGDAGLGKSRLVRELAVASAGCRVFLLRSHPDATLRLYGLLRGMLAVQCGVTDADSAEVARRKVVEGLRPWFAEDGERQAQIVGQLSGLDFGASPHLRGLDPRTLRESGWSAVRTYLRALAEAGPTPVLVVEDLHWADDGSLDLLQHLRAHAAELPVALIMTARPSLLERRPDWAAPDGVIALSPLAGERGDELAHELLRRIDPPPARLIRLLVERAEGNPYYMEELVRRLIDDGVIDAGGPSWTLRREVLDGLQLPGTLVGLLQARLDALPAEERLAARQASVIGHVFWDDALRRLDERAPQRMPALQRTEFVRANPSSHFEGTPERQFGHHLLHQVTYDTLLKAERRLGHAAAAQWLAERTRGRGAEFVAMTGEHAERAGEIALAIDCFEQAGREAHKRHALTTARDWLQRALDLLGTAQPHRRVGLLFSLEAIADALSERQTQDALLDDVVAVLDRHPDDGLQAQCLVRRAILLDRRGDAPASEPVARQALEVATRCGAAQPAAKALGHLAWVHCVLQDYGPARTLCEQSLEWAAKIEDDDLRDENEAQLQTLLAIVSILTGRLAEARATLLQVLERGERLGMPRVQIGALDNLAEIALTLGHWHEVLEMVERSLALAHSGGLAANLPGPQMRAAVASDQLGDPVQALRWCELSLASTRRGGDRRREAKLVHDMGDYHRSAGDAASAAQWYARAEAAAAALDDTFSVAEARACRAQCLARLGQMDEVPALVDEVLTRLQRDLSAEPAHATIEMRWACQQALQALGDGRAEPMLQSLADDVRARVEELGSGADRERLTQAFRNFREITAAHQARRPR